jgi:ribosomal protein S18 acetylase RimI-like enzyme
MAPEDYDSVFALWNGTPGVGLNSIDDSIIGISKYLSRNPSTCFIALVNGETVGVILSGHDGRRGFIYHMTVKSEHRGKSIGRALVNTALDALRAEGIRKTALVVMHDNDGGNSFWEALGFSRREDLYYRNISLME